MYSKEAVWKHSWKKRYIEDINQQNLMIDGIVDEKTPIKIFELLMSWTSIVPALLMVRYDF